MRLPTPLDNPFFELLVRRHARSGAGPYNAAFFLAWVGLLTLLISFATWHLKGARGSLSSIVEPLHLLMCLMAGRQAAFLLLEEERDRRTLEGLRLLPFTPLQWLRLKLLYPLWWLGIVWSLLLPCYWILALHRVGSVADLAVRSLWPLWCGLMVIPLLVIFLDPEGTPGASLFEIGSKRKRRDWVRTWAAGAGFVVLPLLALMRGVPWAFFGRPIPAWALPALSLLFIAAGITTIQSVLNGGASARGAHWIRVAALVAAYYAALGMLWSFVPAWLRWTFVGAGPLLVPLGNLVEDLHPGRKEDRLSASELDWLAARWEDPLMIRDLRAYSRVYSIRKSLVLATLALIGFAFGMVYLVQNTALGQWSQAGVLMWPLAITPVIPLIFMPRYRVGRMWSREWRQDTYPLLFLTPLTARQLLLGRIRAAVFYSWTTDSLAFFLIAAGLAWMLSRGYLLAIPVLIASAPLVLLPAVRVGCGINFYLDPRSPEGKLEWVTFGAYAGVALLAFQGHRIPLPLAAAGGVLLAAANAAVVRGWFRHRVEELRQIEGRGEWERAAGGDTPKVRE